MVLKGEVARTFLEVFNVCLFFLITFVLDKYVRYKLCSSDIPLSNKKKFDWFTSRQYGLIGFGIFPKTFASLVKSAIQHSLCYLLWLIIIRLHLGKLSSEPVINEQLSPETFVGLKRNSLCLLSPGLPIVLSPGRRFQSTEPILASWPGCWQTILKTYLCKHAVSTSIHFGFYVISDPNKLEDLGKRPQFKRYGPYTVRILVVYRAQKYGP
jgi:hypothetical protein